MLIVQVSIFNSRGTVKNFSPAALSWWDTIPRYTFRERVIHWFAALTYVCSTATGLALYTPHLFRITVMLGGGPILPRWHSIAGVGFFFAIVWMHLLWRREMQITETGRRFLSRIRDYAAGRNEFIPPQEKYNGGQKLYYWLSYYGTLALLVSGLFLFFPDRFPPSPAWLQKMMIGLHEAAALITIGGLIVHIVASVFFVPGSMTAMLQGSVTKAWARKHHRLWYIRITGGDAITKE